MQEIMDDDQRESGRIPRTVECELTADLGTQYVSCLLLLSYAFVFEMCYQSARQPAGSSV